jgi:hypothetical protein
MVLRGNQSLINGIVPWKVNWYVRLSDEKIEQIKKLKVLQAGEHKKGNEVLKALLDCYISLIR